MESDKAVSGETREKDCYKSRIINMVQNINSCDILIYIYKLVDDVYKEEKRYQSDSE